MSGENPYAPPPTSLGAEPRVSAEPTPREGRLPREALLETEASLRALGAILVVLGLVLAGAGASLLGALPAARLDAALSPGAEAYHPLANVIGVTALVLGFGLALPGWGLSALRPAARFPAQAICLLMTVLSAALWTWSLGWLHALTLLLRPASYQVLSAEGLAERAQSSLRAPPLYRAKLLWIQLGTLALGVALRLLLG